MIIYRRRTLFFLGLRMIKYYLLRNLEKETRAFDISYQVQQFVFVLLYRVYLKWFNLRASCSDILIYLLTEIGFPPGSSSTVHLMFMDPCIVI
jgi:hypothetical protein